MEFLRFFEFVNRIRVAKGILTRTGFSWFHISRQTFVSFEMVVCRFAGFAAFSSSRARTRSSCFWLSSIQTVSRVPDLVSASPFLFYYPP